MPEDLAGEPSTRLLFELEHHRPLVAVDVRELTHGEAAKLVRDDGAGALSVLLPLHGWPVLVKARQQGVMA